MEEVSPPLLPIRQAARRHGLNSHHFYRAIRRGELSAYRIGGWVRVRPNDVDAWIERCRIHPLDGLVIPAKPSDGSSVNIHDNRAGAA